MNNYIYRDTLLLEYLTLTRLQQENLGFMLQTYTRTQTSLNNNVKTLLQYCFNNRNNNYGPIQRNSTLSSSTSLPNSDIRRNTPPSLQLRRNVIPAYNQNNNTGRFTVHGLSNRFSNIFQTSLNTPPPPSPITNLDISNNTTIRLRNEVNSTQEICPISLERFLPSDRVMQINSCGHIFLERSLTTFLQRYDNRCPLCRHLVVEHSRNTNNTLQNEQNNSNSSTIHSLSLIHI